MAAAADPASRRVVTRDDAERILLGLTAALDDLEAALEIETALIGAGRIRDGLAAESRKAELSAAYVLQLQHAKAMSLRLRGSRRRHCAGSAKGRPLSSA
jgi:hypothetical protein